MIRAPTPAVIIEGVGMHTGAPVRVELRAHDGPVLLRSAALEAAIDELSTPSTAWATTVEAHDGRLRVATVEHLFGALAGLGIEAGLVIEVSGPELPLLDGGAAAWCVALEKAGVPFGASPRTRIARPAELHVGTSQYSFAPGVRADIQVRFELEHTGVVEDARWTGDPHDFRDRIAPARTFAVARDLAALGSSALIRHVDPSAVVLLVPPDEVHCVGRFEADEPARHKLLDLLGDSYLHGGPPLGHLRADRPGHASNTEAFRRACAEGIVVRVE